ncbi:MAG: hypothetical protein HYY78_18355 [Betaproteobacteria bacterium]|nr:hypothetical protein [Betaproteobacteria bacterium]
MKVSVIPRAVRPSPVALGLYFRAARNDHTALSQIISTGPRDFHGIVFDASRLKRHKELLDVAEKARLECILDPCTQASATVGGFNDGHAALPWCGDRPHSLDDFLADKQQQIVARLSEFVLEHRFTQCISATHLIRDADDKWLAVDIETFNHLRDHLNQNGGKNIGLIYSLALPYAAFRNEDIRESIVNRLQGLPAHSLWIKVEGCGMNSTAAGLRNYLDAVADFHHLGFPVVADQFGGLVGLSALSLSTVGGLASGITLGEHFTAQHWRRPSSGTKHMLHPRVYFPNLDIYLKPAEAKALFELPGRIKAQFGCSDSTCCPRGVVDMLQNPSRHFIFQRMKQVSEMAKVPEPFRARDFLEKYVCPTTDHVLRLSAYDGLDSKFQQRILNHRKRLDALRVLLGGIVNANATSTQSAIPATRAGHDDRASRLV